MKPKITIQLLNIFRLELKKQSVSYEGTNVGEVIKSFEHEYLDQLPSYLKSKDKKHLNKQILILVNGANINNMDGLNTSLDEGDEVQLSVPIIGG